MHDIDAELKRATPEELLRAVKMFYGGEHAHRVRLIEMGYALAGKDGWRHVAPAWLEALRKREANGG